jgi:hypothetical protein
MNAHAMNALRTSILSVAFVVVCANVGSTQVLDIPEVPSTLPADARTMHETERTRLANELTRLRAAWNDHAQKCRGLVEGSAEHRRCVALRDTLTTAARKLRDDNTRFVNALLKDLAQQDSVLSQSITARLDEIRSLIGKATEASDQQLRVLNEQLKLQIDKLGLVRYQVRRTNAVLGVRG